MKRDSELVGHSLANSMALTRIIQLLPGMKAEIATLARQFPELTKGFPFPAETLQYAQQHLETLAGVQTKDDAIDG